MAVVSPKVGHIHPPRGGHCNIARLIRPTGGKLGEIRSRARHTWDVLWFSKEFMTNGLLRGVLEKALDQAVCYSSRSPDWEPSSDSCVDITAEQYLLALLFCVAEKKAENSADVRPLCWAEW